MLGQQRCGRLVVEAEVETAKGWLPAGEIELRVFLGNGFHAGLSECFGMPYVFGIAVQEDGDGDGVDTGWGSDCSNFLAHAWRRSGLRIEWGDPGILRRQLDTIAEDAGVNSGVKLDAPMIARGVAVDFGRHIAALWQDHPPLGVLDAGDEMVHHLGGRPEVLTLAELARERGRFAVRTPHVGKSCRLLVVGDVVLAGDSGTGLADLASECADSDLALANLEGVASALTPEAKKAFDFRFPPTRLADLRTAGVRVVSMANNHAADAGLAGIVEGRAAAVAAGLGVVGAGRDLTEALQPWRREVKGSRLAVFGVCLVSAPPAGPKQAGVLCLPDHAQELAAAIAAARADGARVVVMVHWGDEHVTEPNAEQREWTRWFARRGVAVVAGSGPHVVQKSESHGGTTVAYSLGNAVYPLKLQGRGSGCWWHLTLNAAGNVLAQDAPPVTAPGALER